MRIAKPLLLVTTPIGVIGGIHEAFRLTGGLAFLMIAMMSVIGIAMFTVASTIRRERREMETAAAARGPQEKTT